MTLQLRSFLYSLALHTFFGAIFIFFLTHTTPPEPPETIKISLNTLQAQEPIPPKHIQKPTPIEPTQPQKVVPITKVQPSIPQKISPAPIQKTPPVAIPQPAPPVVVTQSIVTTAPISAPKKAPPPPPPPPNVQKEFLNAHLGEIREILAQNLKYPKMAQKLRMQGEVRIAFSLDSDGSVSNIKVIESSGFDLLDSDAASLIEKTASRFPKPSESVRISVPLSYVLR